MFIVTDLTDMYALEGISSGIQTYFGSILSVKPRDVPPMFCFNVQTDTGYSYSSSCIQRVGVVKSLVNISTQISEEGVMFFPMWVNGLPNVLT